MVALITGAFWALTQLLPQATNTVVNQTLTQFGISDVALVYQIITVMFFVSILIVATIIALFILGRRKGKDDSARIMMQNIKRRQEEWARDKARDKFSADLELESTKLTAMNQTYSISLVQEPEIIRMREIRVQLGPNDQRKEQAWFYVVSLGVPLGAEDATEVQPCFKYPTTNDLYPLAVIPTTGKPWIHVTWPPPPTAPDFDKEEEGFAKALLRDKDVRIEKMNLGAGHALQPFIFLFTVRGRNVLYVAAHNLIAFNMPTKFQTALHLQAEGRPRVLAKVFEVNARSWDSVSVNEVRG